ncbi:MAG TPA: restriction endonuclease [Candidatus Acidoferrum sp.]|nr:restriction endonuclease [Candidatus Acidoferrum sp.]
MATCERCGLSKWFLSLSDNGLCAACADSELKEAAEKSHAPVREIDKPAQTEKLSSDSPSADSVERVPSLQEAPIPHFDKYVGQEEIRKDVLPRIEAAVRHSRPLPHLLLSGPPEMGKATLAYMIAGEMKVNINRTYGPVVGEPASLARLLTELEERDFLLVEQIESLKEPALEALMTAIEDSTLELPTDREPKARSLKLQLKRFTLVGTTSKPWQVDKRLRRWMIRFDFTPYSVQEIGEIVKSIGNLTFDPEAATLLAQHCEGSPGNARVMVKRLRNYVSDYATDHVTVDLAKEALVSFGYIGKPSARTYLASNVCSMTAVAFKEFAVSLFREMGYAVEIAPGTSDDGIDLFLRKNNQFIAVQCKRWSAPVGEPVVRDFYSALMSSGAQSGYVVTTSTFTSHAYSFAEGKPLQLVDLEALVDLATGRGSKPPRSGKQKTR